MKKKSKAAAEPTLVFYKKVEWEQMAFRRRREEIMVAVSGLLSALALCAVPYTPSIKRKRKLYHAV